ncbi:MAG: transporter [Streptococcaceae bacterium]|jgi:O-antigen/teichoic acid export membrane protein|nr:transporter [Streptococcaceae bacterium]
MSEIYSSRTKNTMRNATISGITQMFIIITRFIIQTIFMYKLGKAYTGLNGVFNNVILVLNIAELGISNALFFSMYKALAKKDLLKIAGLMNFYRKIYHSIGVVIAGLGLLLVPFLPLLIRGNQAVPHVTFIYFLFLLNTVSSYFFSFKRNLLTADQKEYLNQINLLFYTMLQTTLQIFVLLIFKAYIIYLLIFIVFQLISNFSISHKVDQMYPFLKENRQAKIDKEELLIIKRNTKELIGGKISEVTEIGTDNLLLSSIMGIQVAGIYSSYELIKNAVLKLFQMIIFAACASVGNFVHSNKNKKQVEKMLYRHFRISFILALFSFTCLLNLLRPFILIWDKSYLVSPLTIWLISFDVALKILRNTPITFFSALGTYQHMGVKSIIESLLNLIFSTLLLSLTKLGIASVVLGTILANVFINAWWEPYQIYRLYFKKKCTKYLVYYWQCLFLMLTTGALSFLALTFITAKNLIADLLLSGMISIAFSFTAAFLFVRQDTQFILNNLLKKIRRII